MTKKIIAIVLIIVTITVLGFQQSFASSIADDSVTVYVDGIKFKITEEGENIIIATEQNQQKTKMVLDALGNGKVYTTNEKGKEEVVDVKIKELTEENVCIIITSSKGESIEYNSIEDLQKDEYIGQTTAVIGIGYTAVYVTGLIIAALLVSATIYYIGGVAYRALDYALQKAKIALNSYYRAYRYQNKVLVSTSTISYSTAVARIRSRQDIYTYYKSNARSAVAGAGLGVIGPEIDSRTTSSGWIKRGIYYYHYHPGNRSCHAFYGVAYVY